MKREYNSFTPEKVEECCDSSTATSSNEKTLDVATKQQVSSLLTAKIKELEASQNKEKEKNRNKKRLLKDFQKIVSNPSLGADEKIQQLQLKMTEQVEKDLKLERELEKLQDEMRQMEIERETIKKALMLSDTKKTKLEELCRALQQRSDAMLKTYKEHSDLETKTFIKNMDIAITDVSARLDEQVKESEACQNENIELKQNIVKLGDFIKDMEKMYKEQLKIKDSQITFLRGKVDERMSHASKTEELCKQRVSAAEEARDSMKSQLQDCKGKFDEFLVIMQRSENAFRELKSNYEKNVKEKLKLASDYEELQKKYEISQLKLFSLTEEKIKTKDEISMISLKLEQCIDKKDYEKVVAQRDNLEKLCRALQAEVKDLRGSVKSETASVSKEKPEVDTEYL